MQKFPDFFLVKKSLLIKRKYVLSSFVFSFASIPGNAAATLLNNYRGRKKTKQKDSGKFDEKINIIILV